MQCIVIKGVSFFVNSLVLEKRRSRLNWMFMSLPSRFSFRLTCHKNAEILQAMMVEELEIEVRMFLFASSSSSLHSHVVPIRNGRYLPT